jgi:FixJ family two-component response regulator
MSATTPVVHVVDDDESFRVASVRLLRAAGYEARGYASAGDFLLEPPGPDAHGCLILDVRMPGPSAPTRFAFGLGVDIISIVL